MFHFNSGIISPPGSDEDFNTFFLMFQDLATETLSEFSLPYSLKFMGGFFLSTVFPNCTLHGILCKCETRKS